MSVEQWKLPAEYEHVYSGKVRDLYRTPAGDLLLVGGSFLAVGMFVGRPYCRWLCPNGALLSVFSRYAWRSFSITPDRELDCGLCSNACPYGAIEERRAVRTTCFACGRCYGSCPVHDPARRVETEPDTSERLLWPTGP